MEYILYSNSYFSLPENGKSLVQITDRDFRGRRGVCRRRMGVPRNWYEMGRNCNGVFRRRGGVQPHGSEVFQGRGKVVPHGSGVFRGRGEVWQNGSGVLHVCHGL